MDKLLVKKYFNDQCTTEEAQRVEDWLTTSEGQQFLVEHIDRDTRVVKEFDDTLDYPNTPSDKLFENIQQTIDEKERTSRMVISLEPRTWIGIAAAVLLSIFVVLFVFEQNEHVKEEQLIYPKIVTTEADADSVITLKDGSTVHLNSNSELIINDFTETARNVELIGKAYFEIENDPERPFVVQTNYSYIRVLGTKFEVEAYPGMSEVRVKVDEGKVRFFSKDNRVEPIDLVGEESGILRLKLPDEILEKGSEINTEEYEKPILIRHRSVEEENPKIKFVDNRLFIALNYLERHYDVDIELENDSLRNTRFTLTTDQSLLGAVERIADSLNLQIEFNRNEDKLYLKRRDKR